MPVYEGVKLRYECVGCHESFTKMAPMIKFIQLGAESFGGIDCPVCGDLAKRVE